jgi:tRNA threonylcarbamoyl adenosine modification protein YeaZ
VTAPASPDRAADAGDGTRLVLDTATTRTVVALGRERSILVERSRDTPGRHGTGLQDLVAGALADAAVAPSALSAVGVGLGPGSFTGLRVGLATAKTLAWTLGLPIVGILTTDALRHAAVTLGGPDAAELAVLQPAGARDHYLALPDGPPRLVPPAADLAALVAGRPVLAIDVDPARIAGCRGLGPDDPLALGERVRHGFAAALLALLEERLAAGTLDDAAALVPAYVALPRGIAQSSEHAGWSPDLR